MPPDDARPRDARAPRVPDDWYVGFHRGLAARFWRAAAAAMADDDARLVRRLLALAPGARVLDVPCGDGRLTVRLAAAGLDAVGVDLAAEELELARAAAAPAGVEASFLVGDLRALPDVGAVDGVVSCGNSFGYLIPTDTARSLAGMRRALRPGGRLVLESLTIAESLLVAGVREERELEAGGVRMTTRVSYRAAESRLESDYVFEDEHGRVERARAAHLFHTSGELVRLLRGAGFAEVVLLGPDGERPYELGSPRLIAWGRGEGRHLRAAVRADDPAGTRDSGRAAAGELAASLALLVLSAAGLLWLPRASTSAPCCATARRSS